MSSTAKRTAIVPPELLTCAQAAAVAGCGVRTWWRWTRCGLAPHPLKIGLGVRPAVRWSRREIEQWVQNGCMPVEKERRRA